MIQLRSLVLWLCIALVLSLMLAVTGCKQKSNADGGTGGQTGGGTTQTTTEELAPELSEDTGGKTFATPPADAGGSGQ